MSKKIYALICAISLFGLTMPVYGAQPSVDFDQLDFGIKEIIEQLDDGADALPFPCPGARGAEAELQVRRQGNSLIFESPAVFRAASDSYTEAYKNGDVVFLIGNLKNSWTEEEWNRFYRTAKWLVKNDFRVIMNPVAYGKDAQASVQDDRTKIIIWSSHGSTRGVIYDSSNKGLHYSVFNRSVGKNLRQIVFSTCNGEKVVRRYDTPERVSKKYWIGDTDTAELFKYLNSDKWNPTRFGPNR